MNSQPTPHDQNKQRISGKVLLHLYFLACSLASLAGIIATLNIPSDQKNAIFLGFSSSRIIIIFLLFLMLLFWAALFFLSLIEHPLTKFIYPKITKSRAITDPLFLISVISFLLGLIAALTPPYRFQARIASDFVRLQPLIITLGSFGLLTLVFRRIWKRSEDKPLVVFPDRKTLIVAAGILLCFLIFGAMIKITGFGLISNEDFWYEAGVPVFWHQIFLAFLAALIFHFLESSQAAQKSSLYKYVDQILALLIFVSAAALWAGTPAPNGFLNPRPVPPNFEVYPYADAARFDLDSQYALIGQGISGGSSNRPVYPTLLLLMHLVAGQSYDKMMAVQAIFYAVFPVILFFIGKILYDRKLGIVLAVLVIERGINGIKATNLLNLANQKQILTDFPTAIWIGLLTLLLIVWLKLGKDDFAKPILVGGILGFAFLTRHTALAIGLSVIFCAWLVLRDFPKTMKATLLFMLGFLLVLFPWGIRNQIVGGNGARAYFAKINLVIKTRYTDLGNTQSAITDQTTGQNPESTNSEEKTPSSNLVSVTGVIAEHFVHNLLTSILILPASPSFDTIQHAVKSEGSYWKPSWNGYLSTYQIFWLVISLGILSLGFATAWKHSRIYGMIPLFSFLVYQFANAWGRSSGGRYIVPVDWIVLFYFALGVTRLAQFAFPFFGRDSRSVLRSSSGPQLASRKESLSFLNPILKTSLQLLLIACLLPLIELPFPQKYPYRNTSSLITEINRTGGMDSQELATFLRQENAVLLSGQAMYPRFYLRYKGLIHELIDMPVSSFTVMDNRKPQDVILIGPAPDLFPNLSTVIVVGCKRERYVEAWIVVLETPQTMVYKRQSTAALICQ